VEYKEHVADHVRAWEGEELSEIYHSSSKINSQKKEENKTSDWSLLGRVWTRKSQKGNKGFFFIIKKRRHWEENKGGMRKEICVVISSFPSLISLN
jgi:hypothetical protein